MTIYGRILLAGLASALTLLAALGFQYIGGLAPCPLCIWQRWPHVAAVAIAALAVTVLWRFRRPLSGLGGIAMLTGAGIAGYHVGIEQGWWPGPQSCSAPDPSGMSSAELLERIMATPMVRCDEVAWEFLGLSMAAWNGLACLGLAGVWLWSIRQPEVTVVEKD